MNQATVRDVTTVPRITHDEAMRIAAVENSKFAGLLRSFEPGDWTKPTDCVLWDVRALAAHVVGSAAGQASPREFRPPGAERAVRSSLKSAASSGGTA